MSGSPAHTPALAVEGVTVRLGARAAVAAASLTVASGELVGLVGPNGAGKSTLLRAALGLVPCRGRIRLGGCELAGLAPRERARLAAYLPQAPDCHWPLAVRDMVALGLLPFGQDAARVRRALAATDIAALADRPMSTLSGGERARAFLARAIVGDPPLLLADEPVAGLDPAHQLAVMAMLRGRAQAGAAVLIVLHDLTHAARFCDRLALIDQGRIVADGRPAAVLTPARLAAVYGVRVETGAVGDRFFVVPVERVVQP